MASRVFTHRPTFFTGLASASTLLLHPTSPISILQSWRKPLLCDTFSPSSGSSSSSSSSSRTPFLSSASGSRGGLNPAAVKQITLGSILGLASGLAISTFSRSLAVIFGLFIITVQFIESRLGIRVIPRDRIQRWFKSIDVRNVVEGNVPFKITYAAALLLAGWGRFED